MELGTQAGDTAVAHRGERSTPSIVERASTATKEMLWRAWRGENSGILILVVMITIAIFAIVLRDTDYLTATNLLSIVEATAPITIMAVPTVYVICCGELDLSFAAIVPVSAYIASLILEAGDGIVLAVAAALGFGLGVGLINGLVTVAFRIPSFVVTLGTMGMVTGLATRMTNSESVTVEHESFLSIFGQGDVGPFPVLLVWSLVIVVIAHVFLVWTPAGKALLATGANRDAARFSGIRTNRIKVGALMFSGFGGALAGLLYVGQFGAASYTLGTSDLLTAIAAAIIGGTVLAGGKGSVVGALVGSLLIGILNNGLVILGLADPEQLMVRGAIIIAAVIFSARAVTRTGAGASRWGALLPRRKAQPVSESKGTAST